MARAHVWMYLCAHVECVSVFVNVCTVNVHDSGSENTCALNFGSNIRIERALGVDYHRVKRQSFIVDRH